MKKYFLLLFMLLLGNVPLHSQNDFFPLKIGNEWNYSYKSIERQFYDIAFMYRMSTDSGSVNYSIIDSTNQDSILLWNIKENDIIKRRIQEFSSEHTIIADTTYMVNASKTFQMCEYLDSAHTLKSESYYEVFTFPVKWGGDISSSTPITRFRQDSSISTIKENKFIIASYSDSLVFQMNKGLVYAKSIIDKGPNTPYYYEWEASLSSFLTSVENKRKEIPKRFELFQNYPNPFNPETIISFSVFKRSEVTLTIYDVLGRIVSTLINGEENPGEYNIKYTPTNISSGILVYQLKTSEGIINKKMMYLK